MRIVAGKYKAKKLFVPSGQNVRPTLERTREALFSILYSKGIDFSQTSVLDVFAGTGAVGSFFANKGYHVILNDTLYSNVLAYKAWHGEGPIDEQKLDKIITYLNDIRDTEISENYFSEIYGGKYFSVEEAKKITESPLSN